MKLLLAEDERELSRALVRILEHNQYTVDPVYDGEEALAWLEMGEYDGVILDVMMPKKDGIQVLQAMRRRGDATPVLILTAKDEVEDKVLGLDSGADDYLTKPFAVQELLARIRAMTREKTAFGSSVLTFGNLSLDRATGLLSSPAGQLRLPNKEYQMLELLMANPRQLVPTQRFMDRIWGYDSDTELKVVWVYLSYLRKKLAALEANVEIRSSRGLGYSLEEKP